MVNPRYRDLSGSSATARFRAPCDRHAAARWTSAPAPYQQVAPFAGLESTAPMRRIALGLVGIHDRKQLFSRGEYNTFVVSLRQRHHIDRDLQLLLAAAADDAVDGGDVCVVAAGAEDDVLVLDEHRVGRVEPDPADVRA